MTLADPLSLTIVTGLLMVVGLVGIVVPVVPGLLLTVGATLLWAYAHPAPGAWVVFWIAVVLYAAGVVTQYLLLGARCAARASAPRRCCSRSSSGSSGSS